MGAGLGAAELVELVSGFADGGTEAVCLGALGVDEALGPELNGGIEAGRDAGFEEKLDDPCDQGLFAGLDGDCFGEKAVVEEQVLLGGQRLERAEEAADGLLGGFHEEP